VKAAAYAERYTSGPPISFLYQYKLLKCWNVKDPNASKDSSFYPEQETMLIKDYFKHAQTNTPHFSIHGLFILKLFIINPKLFKKYFMG